MLLRAYASACHGRLLPDVIFRARPTGESKEGVPRLDLPPAEAGVPRFRGRFRRWDNAVRLQLHALAYDLANFMRTPALPKEVVHWSLTTLRA